jgi:hypothetical protein
VKLRVHTIVGGRYVKAGEDVPDDLVSPSIAKYAVDPSHLPPKRQLSAGKHPNMRPGAQKRRRNGFDWPGGSR